MLTARTVLNGRGKRLAKRSAIDDFQRQKFLCTTTSSVHLQTFGSLWKGLRGINEEHTIPHSLPHTPEIIKYFHNASHRRPEDTSPSIKEVVNEMTLLNYWLELGGQFTTIGSWLSLKVSNLTVFYIQIMSWSSWFLSLCTITSHSICLVLRKIRRRYYPLSFIWC